MPQYLVAIQHPDGYDGSLEGEAMMRDIHALNEEMEAAGDQVWPQRLRSPVFRLDGAAASFSRCSWDGVAATVL